MKLSLRLLMFFLSILCSACEDRLKDTVPEDSKPVAEPLPPPVPKYRSLDIGEGKGDLVIDGIEMDLQCNDTLRIMGGAYNSITIKNVLSPPGCNITIKNNGIVELKGDFKEMKLENLRGVNISGDGTSAVKYGFQFIDNVYRSILISGLFTKSTIQHMSFKNIRDYAINYNFKTEYDETQNTQIEDIRFLHLFGEGTGRLIDLAGSVDNNRVTGYIKGLEIAYMDYRNSDYLGAIAFVGNAEDYNIHHNRVDNVNRLNDEHNGIFHICGNGRFHNNYISNHQGNALRAWIYTVGTVPKEILIYNNIIVNSRKYSAFEVQFLDRFLVPKVTYSNVKIYNNTCGSINLSKDWYGNIADVYNLQGGNCDIINNLSFDFPAQNPGHNIYNQQGSTIPFISANQYFELKSNAEFADETLFTLQSSSICKNAGESVVGLDEDYYGIKRNLLKPSIGAVE